LRYLLFAGNLICQRVKQRKVISMKSFAFRTILVTATVGLVLLFGIPGAFAGKPGKPGGGGGGTIGTQTIYYIDGDDLRSVDENGQYATYIGGSWLKDAAITSLVYGTDPALDRWFLTSEPVSASQYEIFAYHPGLGIPRVQVTDLASEGRTVGFVNADRPHVRLSNDGGDSFFSFFTYDSSTGNDRRIVRANLSIELFDAAVTSNVWAPLNDSDLEVVWQDPADLSVQAMSWYSWNPAGTAISLVTYSWGAPNPFALINYSVSDVILLDNGLSGSAAFPRWSPQSPDRVLYQKSGIRLVTANATSNVSVLANTSKVSYVSCEWSPNGNMFALAVATKSGGPFSTNFKTTIAKSSLSGSLTTLVPASSNSRYVTGWRGNSKAAGY
jgi:hypothetical protein